MHTEQIHHIICKTKLSENDLTVKIICQPLREREALEYTVSRSQQNAYRALVTLAI